MTGYNAMDAVTAGANFIQTMGDNARKTKAYNALAAQYGPAAGDPTAVEAAAKLQDTQQNAQAFPLLQQQRQQTLDQDAQSFPLEQQKRQAAIAQSSAETSKLTSAQELAAGASIINSLSEVASSGGDVGAAFDRFAPAVAQMHGIAPDHLGKLREAIVANPTETLGSLKAGLAAAGASKVHVTNVTPSILPDGTPGQIITFSDGHQQYATGASPYAVTKGGFSYAPGPDGALVATPIAGTPQAAKVAAAGQKNEDMAGALRGSLARIASTGAALDQVESLIPQLNPNPLVRQALAHVAGSPEYQIVQLQKTIDPSHSLTDLQLLNQAGTTIGRTSVKTFEGSAKAIANFDLGQDIATLRGSVAKGKAYLNTTTHIFNDQINSLGGANPASQGGSVPPDVLNAHPVGGGMAANDVAAKLATVLPGFTVSGMSRTPKRNAEVGGVANSPHLDGHGLDFEASVSLPQAQAQIAALGLPGKVIYEGRRGAQGPHFHYAWPKGSAPTSGKQAAASVDTSKMSDADLIAHFSKGR